MGALNDIRLPRVWRNDGSLTVAVAHSRHDTKWRNVQRPWSALAAKLSEPFRSGETTAEFDSWPKDRRAAVKDVGGYVGGALQGGRRIAAALRLRQLIVLDIDYGTREAVVGALDPSFGFGSYTWILHTTRSDRSWVDVDRLRLLIPLSRPVTADEYPAVARRIAGDLGIEAFDDSTFEPHRLMYWPSCSADQPYWITGNDGPWLDVDRVLARYEDWRDPREWPVSSRARESRAPVAGAQAEDPTKKPGLVGAFCRRYAITDVLTGHLSGVYAPHSSGRWTYSGGSTAGGLVIYDNLWAYSHHGTDPAGGRLVNAWDLVRIHKFGDLDKDEPESTPLRDMPSTREMLAWAGAIPEIREQLARDRIAAAVTEFAAEEPTTASAGLATAAESLAESTSPSPETADDSWMRTLEVTDKGAVRGTRHNISLILRNDPHLSGRLGFDEMAGCAAARGRLPWSIQADVEAGNARAGTDESRGTLASVRRWTDRDDAGLRAYLERVWRIDRPNAIQDAVEIVSRANGIHPVREYLRGLPAWDGVPRLDTLFTDYLGAEDTAYIRAAARKMAVAAIARVMHPGCKADHVVCLAGAQGVGKSSLLRILGAPWHTDSLPSIHGKEGSEAIAGTWIVEIAELVATRKADIESVKAFISRQVERYRPAYGRRVIEQPRQCIFVATTNDMHSLTDQTGNRRYWPVNCTKVGNGPSTWASKLAKNRDQLWAEAMARWVDGEPLWLETTEAAAGAEAAQAEHTDKSDDLSGEIGVWLDTPVPTGWSKLPIGRRCSNIRHGLHEVVDGSTGEVRSRVCAREVWLECIGGTNEKWNRNHARRIGDAMDVLPGWERTPPGTNFGPYGKGRGWRRTAPAAPQPPKEF